MRKLQNSLLLRIGGMIATITLLALVSMSMSWMVADTIQGHGEAINITGSLRMQSWRIVTLCLQQQNAIHQQNLLDQAVQRFEEDVNSSSILAVIPVDKTAPLQHSYQQVIDDWQKNIRPYLLQPNCNNNKVVLDNMPTFVDHINNLVKQIEQATEAKILALRVILGGAIIGTFFIVILSIYLINNILVIPLGALLGLTERIRHGNLDVRTDFISEDEIGKLGRAFNSMAEDLSKSYQNLEARVEQKTAELTRSNRSLELLYRSITRLHGVSPDHDVFQNVLRDAETVLGLKESMICLKGSNDKKGKVIEAVTTSIPPILCKYVKNCSECYTSAGQQSLPNGQNILRLPLADAEKHYGILAVDMPNDKASEQWQVPLLEALSRHIGVTLASEQRIEQHRRVALLEERAVIARELHDSLAQSLAYMKIQVSRLRTALKPANNNNEIMEALEELRDGLNSSYQQLRELLSTFRLRMEEADLSITLTQTVNEFAERGHIPIQLDIDLANINLSPNEEIHLLQIVREALSNILKHSEADQAWVTLRQETSSNICLQVEDNGLGIQKTAAIHHYGVAIMQERARALHGSIEYLPRDTGGTKVKLSFNTTLVNSIKF